MEANSKDSDSKMCISLGVVKVITTRVTATKNTGQDIKYQKG
jgi:hypothetical protein